MKVYYLLSLFIAILFHSFSTVHGQTITESFGGIKVDYKITSDTLVLSTDSQILIKRGDYDFYIGSNGGYGYGIESIHLEFISNYSLMKINEVGNKSGIVFFYKIQFFDENNKIIVETNLSNSNINAISNSDGTINSFSVNLFSIPLPVLEKAKRINIINYKSYLKKIKEDKKEKKKKKKR